MSDDRLWFLRRFEERAHLVKVGDVNISRPIGHFVIQKDRHALGAVVGVNINSASNAHLFDLTKEVVDPLAESRKKTK